MPLPKKVILREVGMREGFQLLKNVIPLDRKLELLSKLNETGISEIEFTSLVRSDRVPQMADADEFVKRYVRRPGILYSALYLNEKGFERGEKLGRLDNRGWVYSAASDTFLKKNSNTTQAEVVDGISSWRDLFGAHGKQLHGVMISAAFGCNDEGPVSRDSLCRVVERLWKSCEAAGALPAEISLADTMGWGSPEAVKDRIKALRNITSAVISLHLHDTRGLGVANVYAGLEMGVDIFEASLGGVGGCPFVSGAAGNVATEEVVHLCDQLGIATGVSLDKYVEAVELLEKIVGFTLPSKLSKGYKGWARS